MDFGAGVDEEAKAKAAEREAELLAQKKKQDETKAAEEAARRAGLRGARSLISRAYGAAGGADGGKTDALGG